MPRQRQQLTIISRPRRGRSAAMPALTAAQAHWLNADLTDLMTSLRGVSDILTPIHQSQYLLDRLL